MGWIITLGIFTLLAVLPLGVAIVYNSEGFLARVVVGPVKITVFPRPKKAKKQKKQITPSGSEKTADPTPSAKAKAASAPKQSQPKKEKGGSWTDFLPLVKLAVELLGDFRRKLRLDDLQLKLILAADDPCDLAVNYGRAWAAVGNLMPQLERLFVIKKRNVEVACDFTASETLVLARLKLTITLGRLLLLVLVYGIRALVEFLKIKKKRKGGAVT